MTPSDLAAVGQALYGPRWQTDLAADLGHDPKTIQRWLNGQRRIPADLPGRLDDLLEARAETIRKLRGA
jgi:plasmid maintenance system antidote protein VapI